MHPDLDFLQGQWRVIDCRQEEHALPDTIGETATIYGDQLASHTNTRFGSIAATLRIDANQEPKWMDEIDGDSKVLGIYEIIDAITWRFCYQGINGDPRPTNFSTADHGNVLYVYRRIES